MPIGFRLCDRAYQCAGSGPAAAVSRMVDLWDTVDMQLGLVILRAHRVFS